jgi:hypothetical protein
MNIKKTAKKIVALAGGSLMLGATLMGAMAQDLSDYPSQFMTDGLFNGYIVVGANAATQDVLGAIDIAAALQAASTNSAESTNEYVGDTKQVLGAGNILEIGEQVGDVLETLTEDDLQFLASGRITNSRGTTTFNQHISLQNNEASVFLTKNHSNAVGQYLFLEEGTPVFEYNLEFSTGLKSTIVGGAARDFEGVSVNMLGSVYTIVNAKTNGTDTLELDLIAGDVTDTLSVGQTKTYNVDGKDYEVSVLLVDSTGERVKFLINGEVTPAIRDGETDVLQDGLEIGVREILATTSFREKDPSSLVEFYLGANKLTLKDMNITDAAVKGTVVLNRKTIDDANVQLDAVISGGEIRLNGITYTLSVDANTRRDVYVPIGESVKQYLDQPQGFLGDWDISFEGFASVGTTAIEFNAVRDNEYEFTFTNRHGTTYTVPYLYATGGTGYVYGDEDYAFVFRENDAFNIKLDDSFVVTNTNGGALDNKYSTYVLRFVDVNDVDNYVIYEDIATGEQTKKSFTGTLPGPVTGQITIKGQNFDYELREVGGEYEFKVDLDNDGSYLSAGHPAVPVVTEGGAIVHLGMNTRVRTLEKDTDDAGTQLTHLMFSANNGELDAVIVQPAVAGEQWTEYDRTQKIRYTETAYGALFMEKERNNGATTITVEYPLEQREALVYVHGGAIAPAGAQSVSVLPVGLAVLDTQVNLDDENLIIMGGPCANILTAELMGFPEVCTDGFEKGLAHIRLFDTGDKVAMVVAGFDGSDTNAAARIVAETTVGMHQLTGNMVEVVNAGGAPKVKQVS